MTKFIDLIIEIHSFDKQCVIIKGLLQPKLLKQHMVTIVVGQSSSNSKTYEHRCLENIKKLYKSSGKYDDQQQKKYIKEAATVSTPEIFNKKILMPPIQSMTVKCKYKKITP